MDFLWTKIKTFCFYNKVIYIGFKLENIRFYDYFIYCMIINTIFVYFCIYLFNFKNITIHTKYYKCINLQNVSLFFSLNCVIKLKMLKIFFCLFVIDILWLSETDQQKKSWKKTKTKKEVAMRSSLSSLITMMKQQSMPTILVEKRECLTMW